MNFKFQQKKPLSIQSHLHHQSKNNETKLPGHGLFKNTKSTAK
jgi:hypothetical protein